MPTGRTRFHLHIKGRVQGVYFRELTRQLAEQLDLGGWVRNLSDGQVEAVFEGDPARVAQAVAWCRKGPPGAWVSGVETRDEEPLGETGFRILSTRYAWEQT